MGSRSRFYSLALSDPSPLEVAAVLLGVLGGVAGFFVVVARQAYLAGVYAAPITPYGAVRGFVPDFGQPPPVPSEAEVRALAAGAFVANLVEARLQLWLVAVASLFVAVYPLASRLKAAAVPASGVVGAAPVRVLWWGLAPVLLVSLGFSLALAVMSVVAYTAYFGLPPSRGLAVALAGVTLYIAAVAVAVYGLLVAAGRPEAGVLLGFLGALGAGRAELGPLGLLAFGLASCLASLLLLAVALSRRWLAL